MSKSKAAMDLDLDEEDDLPKKKVVKAKRKKADSDEEFSMEPSDEEPPKKKVKAASGAKKQPAKPRKKKVESEEEDLDEESDEKPKKKRTPAKKKAAGEKKEKKEKKETKSKSKSKEKIVIDIETPHVPNLNEGLTRHFDQLAQNEKDAGNFWPQKALQKVSKLLAALDKKVTCGKELVNYAGVGPGTIKKIDEYLADPSKYSAGSASAGGAAYGAAGSSAADAGLSPREAALKLFQKITGVGPAKAKQWVDKGIFTMDELRAQQSALELTPIIKIGLQYFDDLQQLIPRQEMELMDNFIKGIAQRVDPRIRVEQVGAFSRGEKKSDEIRFLVTDEKWTSHGDKDPLPAHLAQFIKEIKSTGFVSATMIESNKKFQIIGKLPASVLPSETSVSDEAPVPVPEPEKPKAKPKKYKTIAIAEDDEEAAGGAAGQDAGAAKPENVFYKARQETEAAQPVVVHVPAAREVVVPKAGADAPLPLGLNRRVDFFLVPWSSFFVSRVVFTASADFLQRMRSQAKKKGLSLGEMHLQTINPDTSKPIADVPCDSEEAVFQHLGLEFVKEENRK